MSTCSSGPAITYRPFMIFIDGGYLRNEIREKFGNDNKMNFSALPWVLAGKVNRGTINMELIRVYYYDAIVDYKENPEKHKAQDSYFERNASPRLVESFDMRIPITEDIINQIVQK